MRLAVAALALGVMLLACTPSSTTKASERSRTTDPAPSAGRPWSTVDGCRGKHPDRPAYLSVVVGGGWSRPDIRRALDRAGLPHGTLDHLTDAEFELTRRQVFFYIPGTVGALLGGGARLLDARPPSPRLDTPEVHIVCAGLASIQKGISIALRDGVDGRRVAARHGGHESARREGLSIDGLTWWDFDTRDNGFVVERVIEYLRDPEVLSADVNLGCRRPADMRPPDGCDTAVVERRTDAGAYASRFQRRTALPARIFSRSVGSMPTNVSLITLREYGQSAPWCG